MGLPLAIRVSCVDVRWVAAASDMHVSPKKQATSVGRAKLLANRHDSARSGQAARIFKDVSVFALVQSVLMFGNLLKGTARFAK